MKRSFLRMWTAMVLAIFISLAHGSGYAEIRPAGSGNSIGSVPAAGGDETAFATMDATLLAGAHLSGKVVTGVRANVAGAVVSLTKTGTAASVYTATTATDGAFSFPALPAGTYTVYAELGERKGMGQTISLGDGESSRVTLAIPLNRCTPGRTPLLLVPGVTGSSIAKGVVPELPGEPPPYNDTRWNTDTGGLHDPLLFGQKLAGWMDLVDTLVSDYGYDPGCTLFPVPYDWRMSISADDPVNGVDTYIIPMIEEAKARSGMAKVHVIGHSLGALLVRSYIQSDRYLNDIDKFAMVAPPNHGSGIAYYLWEGGDAGQADAAGGIAGAYVGYFAKTIERMYVSRTMILPPRLVPREETFYAFIREIGPSVRQLLPIYSFLNPGNRKILCGTEDNMWLQNLNRSPTIDRIGKGVIDARIFAGTGEETLSTITTAARPVCSAWMWKDGMPKYDARAATGDGTLLPESALLAETPLPATTWAIASHACLVKAHTKDLIEFITGKTAQGGKSAFREASLPAELTLSIAGAARPYIRDPSGNGAGLDPDTGVFTESIPGSDTAFNHKTGYIAIRNPADGIYTVHLSDPGNGDSAFSLTYTDSLRMEYTQYWVHIPSEAASFTFALNTGRLQKITLDPVPPIPQSLTSAPSGSVTRLDWSPVADQSVTEYRVYGKEVGPGGTLSALGSTSGTTFVTTVPWSKSASAKTWAFTVAARTADGRESFLADPVLNMLPAIRTLTVTRAGSGTGTVISGPRGISCGATCSSDFKTGTTVTLAATPVGGSLFKGWSGGGCSGTGRCVVAMEHHTAVTAAFDLKQYTVSASVPGGHGSVTPATEQAPYGSSPSITITADPDYRITGITDNNKPVAIANPYIIPRITGNHTIKVVLAPYHTLSVVKSGTGRGTVTSLPAGITCGKTCTYAYRQGTKVTLFARPAPDSLFTGWTGCPAKGACTTTMTADTGITALFSSEPTLIAPASHDFKTVATGKARTATLTLKNGGKKDLHISSITLTAPHTAAFTLGKETCTQKPIKYNLTCSIPLTFAPKSNGPHTATLTIQSDDPKHSSQTIPLTGTATP